MLGKNPHYPRHAMILRSALPPSTAGDALRASLPLATLLATALFASAMSLAAAFPAAAEPAATTAPLARLPLRHNGGRWSSGHVQGIAVDLQGGYLYYSFTDQLAKYDLGGKLIGSLVGWTGHLGDLDFNPDDGKVYGSLEYKADQAFYIAVIEVDRIDRVGIQAGDTQIMRSVYLPEVVADYTADIDGDGRFDGDLAASRDHRYGCSGIDGVGFGPAFGQVDGPRYLTVAYGIYGDTGRSDNDHQVLLQYDVRGWGKYAQPLSEAQPHRSGPATLQGKYFVRTGNTRYGVQNLSYDESLQRWFLGVYAGSKKSFPNYRLFAVDARTPPATGDLVGVAGADRRGWEQGRLLALAGDGLGHPASGVRGWHQKADVGFQPVGDGMFYLALDSGGKGAQSADLTLMRWTGDARAPFVPVPAEQPR
jgi:hypothetical protein